MPNFQDELDKDMKEMKSMMELIEGITARILENSNQ